MSVLAVAVVLEVPGPTGSPARAQGGPSGKSSDAEGKVLGDALLHLSHVLGQSQVPKQNEEMAFVSAGCGVPVGGPSGRDGGIADDD